MDTTTHVVMGLGLGGLAMADPVLAQSPAATEAVMIGTLAGSLAPDFDTVFKMKNNATYIRHHRGISHSIPAILIWSLFISAVILPFFPATAALHLWLWTMLAVFLHVFVDIFNAYGTQALRPFSDKWVRLGIINIFDPVIFGAHLVGIAIWILNLAAPEVTFACVYILLFFYYVWRVQRHHKVLQRIRQEVPAAQYINVSPHFRWSWWHIAIRTASHHIAAEVNGADVRVLETYDRRPLPETEVMDTARQDKNIRSFLDFSPIYRWEINESPNYDEIRFIDLRYRDKDGHYPFVAIAFIDRELNVLSSFTGWVHSEDKLKKKLELAMS